VHTPAPVMAAVGTGLCGALTTYSAFGYETVRLARERARMVAALNAVASVGAGLGAAVAGAVLARAVVT
jgi:fluoride exporter